jgi:translation initiation factor 1 (eIF-1/SUI1)
MDYSCVIGGTPCATLWAQTAEGRRRRLWATDPARHKPQQTSMRRFARPVPKTDDKRLGDLSGVAEPAGGRRDVHVRLRRRGDRTCVTEVEGLRPAEARTIVVAARRELACGATVVCGAAGNDVVSLAGDQTGRVGRVLAGSLMCDMSIQIHAP